MDQNRLMNRGDKDQFIKTIIFIINNNIIHYEFKTVNRFVKTSSTRGC